MIFIFFPTFLCICFRFCHSYMSLTMADSWTFNNKGRHCSTTGDRQCMFDLWDLRGGVGDTAKQPLCCAVISIDCFMLWDRLVDLR